MTTGVVELVTPSCRVLILTYGATLWKINIRMRNNTWRNVILARDSPEEYAPKNEAYLGSTVGRFANRIARGTFQLNEKNYSLAVNNGPNSLHGGNVGFSDREWTVVKQTIDQVTLHLRSEDGDEGYPCSLDTYCTYSLMESSSGEVKLEVYHEAKHADDHEQRATAVNLTQHAYFNLAPSHQPGSILSHSLCIHADCYIPTDSNLIPLRDGFEPVSDVLNFTKPRIIKTPGDTETPFHQYIHDHCYVFPGNTDANSFNEWHEAAELKTSDLSMRVRTAAPSMHVYTARYTPIYKENQHGPFSGICFEPERYVDAVNQPSWRPAVILQPGQPYQQSTEYIFTQ